MQEESVMGPTVDCAENCWYFFLARLERFLCNYWDSSSSEGEGDGEGVGVQLPTANTTWIVIAGCPYYTHMIMSYQLPGYARALDSYVYLSYQCDKTSYMDLTLSLPTRKL